MNFEFRREESFLGLKFNFTPHQVKLILGEPEAIERQYYSKINDDEFDETFHYSHVLRVIFSYENGILSDLSIYTRCMFVEEINIFSLSKIEVLNIFETASNTCSVKAFKEAVELGSVNVEEYEFSDIGIRLWFYSEKLDEVCLFEPTPSDL